MLGEEIKNARKRKKLTLQQLGAKLNLSAGYISHIENNRIVPSNIVLQNLSVHYLIDGEYQYLKAGDSIYLEIQVSHKIFNNTNECAVCLTCI